MSVKPRTVFLAALAAQMMAAPLLWSHLSAPAAVLGRYSTRYAVVLAVSVGIALAYALGAWMPQRAARWIQRTPSALGWGLIVGAWAMVAGLWFTSLEGHVRDFLALNVLLVTGVWLALRDERPASRPFDVWAAGWVVVGLALPLLITALTVSGYHPDEAHYTDYASTFFAEGKLYDRSWLETPYAIEPGWPWQLAAYGWLLERIGYTVYVGRVVNIGAYLLSFAGLYAAGAHLYGRRAGVMAAATAYLSVAFIPEWDYSPNHLLTAVATWALFVLLRARDSGRRGVRWAGYALVGLMVTLSLNVHAAGVVLALAFSLWIGGAWLWRAVRGRAWDGVGDVVAFGVGAAMGTTVYGFANVQPVGGLEVYLSVLGEWDGARRRAFFFYRWESLTERVLIVLALVALATRRTSADRDVLSLVGATVLGAVLLDTQGYIWHYGPYYFLALGAWLHGWGDGWRGRAGRVAVVVMMGLQVGALFVDWPTTGRFVRTGELPVYFYNALKPILPQYVEAGDVVYTTHQLIWVFPHTGQPNIVTYGAEREGMRRYGLSEPVEVWEVVQPTVIIFIDGQMSFDPGMTAYMARHPFEVCEALEVQGTAVTIYREDCAR